MKWVLRVLFFCVLAVLMAGLPDGRATAKVETESPCGNPINLPQRLPFMRLSPLLALVSPFGYGSAYDLGTEAELKHREKIKGA